VRSVADSVSVLAPARLHMGFVDLSGSLGRRFGSVGLTLEGIGVALTAQLGRGISVFGPQAERAERYAQSLQAHLHLPGGVRIEIQEAIPEHVGLGSGTQLGLAVGLALVRLHGMDLPPRKVAALHERGQRSGIGVAAFELGGFLLDGGRGAQESPPPLVARAEFPAHWRVLLIQDDAVRGLHGTREAQAFQTLPPFPDALAADLCRLMLMQILPALLEQDLDCFGRGIAQVQREVGDYFAPVQGGRFASPRVGEALRWLQQQGIAGVGQSSWGPTGFGIVGSEQQARMLERSARERWSHETGLRFTVLAARNRGGEVRAAADVQRAGAARL
jgi:beta-ribofuranosylaminobenzene 5'-phosphate synthase